MFRPAAWMETWQHKLLTLNKRKLEKNMPCLQPSSRLDLNRPKNQFLVEKTSAAIFRKTPFKATPCVELQKRRCANKNKLLIRSGQACQAKKKYTARETFESPDAMVLHEATKCCITFTTDFPVFLGSQWPSCFLLEHCAA